MQLYLAVVLASGLILTGCGQDAGTPAMLTSPTGPTAVTGLGATGPSTPSASQVEVPFHSELTWDKFTSSPDVSACTRTPPTGKVYLFRNTNTGIAVTTHLGTGAYENHTCVYGTTAGPAGWFADIRWTAANGDVLLATSDFLYWTGQPGRSVAVDRVTFQSGGTGRFQYAEGEGMSYVNAPERTAVYDGTLRYGKKEK